MTTKPIWISAAEERALADLAALAETAGTTSKPMLHNALTLNALSRLDDAQNTRAKKVDDGLFPHQRKVLQQLRKMVSESNVSLFVPSASSYEMREMRRHTNIDDHLIYGMPLIVNPKLDKGEMRIVQTKARRSMGEFQIDWPQRAGKNTIRNRLTEMCEPQPPLNGRPKAGAYMRHRPQPSISSFSSVVGFQQTWNSFGLDEWEPYPVDLEPIPVPFPISNITRNLRAALGAQHG